MIPAGLRQGLKSLNGRKLTGLSRFRGGPVFPGSSGETSFLLLRGETGTGSRGFLPAIVFLAGMVAGCPAPVLATPPGYCNPAGSLGTTMGGCQRPPAPPGPRARSGLSAGRTYFLTPMRFRVRTRKKDWKPETRRNIVAWVAKRLVSHPTPGETALLAPTVAFLAQAGFPVRTMKIGPSLYSVTVDSKTLNALANRLAQAIASGPLSYRVNRAAFTGGGEKENRFVEKNLHISPGGVVDIQKLSHSLYALGQLPGFVRADAVFSPAVGVKDVRFDRAVTLAISDRQSHSLRQIRYLIAIYVGGRVLEMSSRQARAIVREVAERASEPWWQPMEMVFGRDKRGRITRVTVSPEALENLKISLIELAQTGVDRNKGLQDPKLSTGEILSVKFQEAGLSDEPVQPTTGEIFRPQAQSPALENLLVHVTPAPTFAGSQIEIDNYGYAPTGALMLNATGNVNNAGVAGGLFTVMVTTSFGGMNSGTVSYSLPLDLANRVGVDLSAMNYTLGEGFSPWGHGANGSQLAALGVSGSNWSGEGWALQTLSQKPDRRLVVKEILFLKDFQDTYSPTSQNDRSLLGGTLDLSGFKAAGSISASFDLSDTEYALTQGTGSDPDNPFYYDTQGLQNYLTAYGQFKYAITSLWSVMLGTVDQQSFGAGVIDPMLQATLGGVSNVMALPTASLFGNDLYVGTFSLTRTDAAKPGTFASSLFFDVGEVSGIGFEYSAMGPGVEESFSAQHWFARADLAIPVGALPTQALGSDITALSGGNIGQGGIPLQVWLSAGLRY